MTALLNSYTSTVATENGFAHQATLGYRRAVQIIIGASIVVNRPLYLNCRIGKLLDEFSTLANNWDGDDAKAPSKIAIQKARNITKLLENRGEKIYHAAPGPNGEVMLDIRNRTGSKSIEIVFYEHRAISVKIPESCMPTQADFSFENLPELLKWLHN